MQYHYYWLLVILFSVVSTASATTIKNSSILFCFLFGLVQKAAGPTTQKLLVLLKSVKFVTSESVP